MGLSSFEGAIISATLGKGRYWSDHLFKLMVRDLAVVTQSVDNLLQITLVKTVLLYDVTDLRGGYHTVFRLVN